MTAPHLAASIDALLCDTARTYHAEIDRLRDENQRLEDLCVSVAMQAISDRLAALHYRRVMEEGFDGLRSRCVAATRLVQIREREIEDLHEEIARYARQVCAA